MPPSYHNICLFYRKHIGVIRQHEFDYTSRTHPANADQTEVGDHPTSLV